jgi:hypothetical protein
MAKHDQEMSREDAPHEVVFTRDTDYLALRKWVRYQGKGRFRIEHFISTRDFEAYTRFRFTDADTAFWAKMTFA